MTSTALATLGTTQYEKYTFDQRTAYAQLLSGAGDLIPKGFFDRSTGKPNPAKIFLAMETGAMLGLHPMAALAGIDVIEGRAAISPQMMTGLLRSHGFKIRFNKTGSIPTGDFAITTTLIRPGDLDSPEDWFTSRWDIPRAIRAGLVESYLPDSKGVYVVKAGKDNWRKYPESMAKWRTVGDVGREGGDDVLLGIGYTPEEMNAVTDADGRVAAPDPETINEFKTRMLACVDKQDLRLIHQELNAKDLWTDELRAVEAEALAGCTTDSKPKPGAPGNTGELAIDSRPTEVIEDAEEVTDEPPAAASGEMTEEQYEAWSAAEADRLYAEEQDK